MRERTSVVASIAAVAALSAPGTASAATRQVPGDYATMQAAIDASANGDVIIVADGAYLGPGNRDLDFGGRAITLRSANGAAHCMIDCAGSGFNDHHRAFNFHANETAASLVQGFTIINGSLNPGGAVFCLGS